jgi:hypothetical protein
MKKKEKQGALAAVIIIIAVAAVVAYAVMSAKPLTWQTDDTLSSSGIQETTQFTVNNLWRVAWMISQEDPIFVLAVYMKNSTGGYSWVADTTTEMGTNYTQGILPVPYTGTFVMHVVASNDTQWVLYIQEWKTA